MLLGVQLFVDLEAGAEFLDDGLGDEGLGLMLTLSKKEPETLAAQRLLLHDAGGGGEVPQTVRSSDGAALQLSSGIYILVEEVEDGVERGIGFIVGGTQADAGLLDGVEGCIGMSSRSKPRIWVTLARLR